MCGYGNRGTGDLKAVVVSVCFLSILGLMLNGGLLDINFEMLKHDGRQRFDNTSALNRTTFRLDDEQSLSLAKRHHLAAPLADLKACVFTSCLK